MILIRHPAIAIIKGFYEYEIPLIKNIAYLRTLPSSRRFAPSTTHPLRQTFTPSLPSNAILIGKAGDYYTLRAQCSHPIKRAINGIYFLPKCYNLFNASRIQELKCCNARTELLFYLLFFILTIQQGSLIQGGGCRVKEYAIYLLLVYRFSTSP